MLKIDTSKAFDINLKNHTSGELWFFPGEGRNVRMGISYFILHLKFNINSDSILTWLLSHGLGWQSQVHYLKTYSSYVFLFEKATDRSAKEC